MHRPISLGMTLVLSLALLGSSLSTPRPVSAAAHLYSSGQWYAEYFANTALSGSVALTRYESDINHDWGTGGPGSGIPNDGFSARFTQDVWFENATYRFTYRSDDGMRMWINDVLVIDNWGDHAAEWKTRDYAVNGGTARVRIEYYEAWGTALMQIGWEKLQSGAVWDALFWNNTAHSGNAVHGRRDAAIDFNWGTGSPDPKVSADNFSARWSRTLGFQAGRYRFYASSDDGVRIYVDGQRIVDAWKKQTLPNTHYADISLGAGNHTVTVEYFEEGGNAAIAVWWDRIDGLRGWEGRYYDNRELRGAPGMIRDDAEINFDWGQGAPASWMASDNFSVRWVRTFNLPAGLYRFNARSDDGVRLWIEPSIGDIDLKLDHWAPQTLTWHYQDWHWLEGQHTLRVEYFEGNGSASVQFWWDYAATVEAARAMAPSPTYRSTTVIAPAPSTPAPSAPGSGGPTTVQLPGPWQGEYFATRDMTKAPVLVRTDTTVDFDWGWNSPAEGIPANQFAVRWTGAFAVEGGRYRLTTSTDDGVRLYVDNRIVLDSWRPMRGIRSTTVQLAPGQHTIRMEYFEATQAAKARLTWQRLGP